MLKKIVTLVVLLSMGFLFSADVKMSEDPWPPYTYGKDGEITKKGIATDIVNELFKRLGMTTENKLFPWKRCLHQMEKGDRDGLMMLTKNADREKFLEFTIPVIEDKDLIWYKKGNTKIKEWADYKDLIGVKIGKSLGFNYGDAFNEAEKKYKLNTEEAPKDLFNFKKLKKGRIDVFICNKQAATSLMNSNPDLKGQFEFMKKPFKEIKFYLAFSKKSSIISKLPEINKILKEMLDEGFIDKVKSKY